jgi:carbon storage regulator CsrA
MLVLSRRPHEKIILPSINTTVQVVEVKSGVVRLGIEAPPEVGVYREEVWERRSRWESPDLPDGGAGPPERGDLSHRGLHAVAAGLAELRQQLEPCSSRRMQAILDRMERELQLLREQVEGVGGKAC